MRSFKIGPVAQDAVRRIVGHRNGAVGVCKNERIGDVHHKVVHGLQQHIERARESEYLVGSFFDHPQSQRLAGDDPLGDLAKLPQTVQNHPVEKQQHQAKNPRAGEQNPETRHFDGFLPPLVDEPGDIDADGEFVSSSLPNGRGVAFFGKDPDISRRAIRNIRNASRKDVELRAETLPHSGQ